MCVLLLLLMCIINNVCINVCNDINEMKMII